MPMLRLSGGASCPARDAPEYLRRFLLEHADGDHAVVALRPELTFSALPDLTLVRDCVVDLRIEPAGASGARASVSWYLAGDDGAVRFDGTLGIGDVSDELACSVLLLGRYHPPPPATLSALERSMGRRIAESTGRDLVGCVTRYLAASYRSAHTGRLNRRTAQR